ncbi:MAG: hypothetical protein K2X41_08920 [Hyphomicrobium sp.]|nr:hypothetical protein [Hyphomicrobium sp.]
MADVSKRGPLIGRRHKPHAFDVSPMATPDGVDGNCQIFSSIGDEFLMNDVYGPLQQTLVSPARAFVDGRGTFAGCHARFSSAIAHRRLSSKKREAGQGSALSRTIFQR